VDVTQAIFVAAPGADSDGDGQPDSNDSCPAAHNSGHDMDQDGIDDSCDAVIGPAPAITQPPTNPPPDSIGGNPEQPTTNLQTTPSVPLQDTHGPKRLLAIRHTTVKTRSLVTHSPTSRIAILGSATATSKAFNPRNPTSPQNRVLFGPHTMPYEQLIWFNWLLFFWLLLLVGWEIRRNWRARRCVYYQNSRFPLQ